MFEKSVPELPAELPELLVCGVIEAKGPKRPIRQCDLVILSLLSRLSARTGRVLQDGSEILAMCHASTEAHEKDRVRGHAYRQTLQISRTRWIHQNFFCGRPNPHNYENRVLQAVASLLGEVDGLVW